VEQKYVLTNQHLANYENIKKHRVGINIMGCIFYLFNNYIKYYLDMKDKNKKELEYILDQSKKVAIAMAIIILTVLILNIIL